MYVTANNVRVGKDNSWKVVGTSRHTFNRKEYNCINIYDIKVDSINNYKVVYKVTVCVSQLNWGMNLATTYGGGGSPGNVFICLAIKHIKDNRYVDKKYIPQEFLNKVWLYHSYGNVSSSNCYSSMCNNNVFCLNIAPLIYAVIPGKKYYTFTVTITDRLADSTSLAKNTQTERAFYNSIDIDDRYLELRARLCYVHRQWYDAATLKWCTDGTMDPGCTYPHPRLIKTDEIDSTLAYRWNDSPDIVYGIDGQRQYCDANLLCSCNSHGDSQPVRLLYRKGTFDLRPC